MDTQPRTPDTLERLRGLWKRRRRPAIAVASLLAAAGAGIALGLPSFYQARTTILVDRANLPAAVATPATTEEIEAKIGALSEMTLSRSRLGELVKRFNLYPDLRGASEDDVVQRMRRDIKLELDHRIPVGMEATVSLSLAYRSTDPATSAAVTNALAAYFLQGEGEKGLRQSSEAADLLRTQMDDVQKKMDVQERLIADYKARQGANPRSRSRPSTARICVSRRSAHRR